MKIENYNDKLFSCDIAKLNDQINIECKFISYYQNNISACSFNIVENYN